MKGLKRKISKSFRAIGGVIPELILELIECAGFFNTSPEESNDQPHLVFDEEEEEMIIQTFLSLCGPKPEPEPEQPEIIDVSELMKGLGDEEEENIKPETAPFVSRENIRYSSLSKEQNACIKGVCKKVPLSKIDISSFRQQDSRTLLDPKLRAVFEQAVMEAKAQEDDINIDDEQPPLKYRKLEEITNPLLDFEEKCPLGGVDSVILYTTGLKVVPKTYQDCQKLKSLLESFQISCYERDDSIHSKYRDELWEILGEEQTLPPRLFIKGRYIGGVEEILKLHEQEKLRVLFEGVPIHLSEEACDGCAGIQFVICSNCNGSRKFVPGDDDNGEFTECTYCNENGLIPCLICC